MKRIVTILSLMAIVEQTAFAQLGPTITSWIINTTGQKGQGQYTDTILANVQTVQYSDSSVYISCTCIPGYDIGPWQGDPNTPVNQNFVFQLPRYPQEQTGSQTIVGLGHVGIWTNGVSIFNAWDAHTYNNEPYWHQNAYYWEGASFDECLGHPQQNGEYHHHVSPKCLYDVTDSIHHSPIIGYAFDGYPVYGAYGYANATDSTSGIKRMTSSYQLRNITTRDTLPNGVVLPEDSAGPAVGGMYPLGAYMEDYQYVPNSGDLDFHNGRYCVTPDYPNGTYAYFVTVDSTSTPAFPYVIGLSYYGVLEPVVDTGIKSGHIIITEATTIYSPDSSEGINSPNKQIKFDLSPNPTDGFAYIYFDPASVNNITGTLYNAKGQLLKTITYMQPSISYALDLSQYPAGMYFLHLESGDVSVQQKIIKVK